MQVVVTFVSNDCEVGTVQIADGLFCRFDKQAVALRHDLPADGIAADDRLNLLRTELNRGGEAEAGWDFHNVVRVEPDNPDT